MSEGETNQGPVYEGYTATAQYDSSYMPTPIAYDAKREGNLNNVDSSDDCDPPIVVERKPKID
jgi:hypothetical protein